MLSPIADSDSQPPTIAPRWLWFLAFAAALLAILPVLAAHHLPLLDAPGHESRLAALKDLLLTGRGSDFYTFDSLFLPNIAFDLVGLGLVTFLEPETAGRMIFALILLLTLSGVTVLNRVATGRWSVVPLAAVLLLYNLISILGFFSFALGLALVPWALAARITLDDALPAPRFVLGAAMSIVLLFCHVFDFGIYAVMATGMAFVGLLAGRLTLPRAALAAAEHLPALILFLAMSTSSAGKPRFEGHFITTKLFGLVKSVTSGSVTGDLAFAAGALLFVAFIAFCSRPRLAAAFLPGIAGLVILYLALPDKLASGSYVDKRMPIAIALMILAALDLKVRRTRIAMLLVGLIATALVLKQAALAVLWRSFDPMIDTLAATLGRLPAGAVILQAECEPEAADVMSVYRERQPSMTHLPAMAAFDDSRFVAATWAIAGQQPVSVAQAYRPYYDLQDSFGSSTCAAQGYRTELQQIENLAWAQKAAGNPPPALYFLLIRPPVERSLEEGARLAAKEAAFELYEVRGP